MKNVFGLGKVQVLTTYEFFQKLLLFFDKFFENFLENCDFLVYYTNLVIFLKQLQDYRCIM